MLCFYSDDLDRDLVSGFQFPCCDYERDLGEGEQGVRYELLLVLQQDREDDLLGWKSALDFRGYAARSSQARRMTLISSGVGRSARCLKSCADKDPAELGGHVGGRWPGLGGYQLMISAPAAP